MALQDKTLSVSWGPDLRLFRQLASGEALPILREVMHDKNHSVVRQS
ncbi:MAG: hypothetical protein K0U40_11240 [Betaproteobacteria bacterium]|nr:hypothetical protein [Betaproteobacteria bacterium]